MTWKRYLLCFAQEHVDFREMEVKSILGLLRISVEWVDKEKEKPYWTAQFQNENDVKKFASRSISLHYCLELYGHTKTKDALHLELQQKIVNGAIRLTDKCFRLNVDTYNRHFSQKEKVEKIEEFNYLPFTGDVNLKTPKEKYYYVEFYGLRANDVPEQPFDLYFGRWVCDGARSLISKLSLKNRKFIGNTSMDAQLSLLMSNFARVSENTLVLDPFVGSGSLLVAAAQFGACVFGTDIDYLMLHAKTKPSRISQKEREKDESIRSNMKQYALEHRFLDVAVSDFSLPLWRDHFQFDAIITDPPYGIREPTERIGSEKMNIDVEQKYLPTHVPSKIGYHPSKLYRDLLNFAAKYLTINGRLVCWIPIHREIYREEIIPSHPCLNLLSNCEQTLTQCTARRLLTYEKIKEFDSSTDLVDDGKILIPDFRDACIANLEMSRREKREARAAERERKRMEYMSKSKIG